MYLDPTYLLDSFCPSSWYPHVWHFTVAQAAYKSLQQKNLGECNLWRYLKAIFLTFKRPRDACCKRMMRVQLLGFIATNSSVMMEHGHAVCVGSSEGCIPGLFVWSPSKNSCLTAYAPRQHVEFPTESHSRGRDGGNGLGGGGLADYKRSSCSSVAILVLKLMHAALLFFRTYKWLVCSDMALRL